MKCTRSTIEAAEIVAFHGMQYGVGDVVLVGSEIMIVEFCVIAKSHPYAVARPLPMKEKIFDTATMCHVNAGTDYVALDIRTKVAVHAKAWCFESKDEVLVLHH